MEQQTGEETAAVLSVPHFSLDVALRKLVKAGYTVGICDQLEDPKTSIGHVKRGVTDLI
jgi:DNA mismatch repair protein MutS